MKIFRKLYDKVLSLANHRHASMYLAGVSFIESSVFPIPPDVMLIPMVMSKPLKAKEYAFITTIASILGGILGYALGYFAFELIGLPMIQAFGYEAGYAKVVKWFDNYGFWAVLIAGFTPIPYKLFTIGAGVSQMAMMPFIIASIIGRTIRFFIVTWLVCKFGKRLEALLLNHIEIICWGVLALAAGIYCYSLY